MADEYLVGIKLDFEQEQLDRITGVISKELTTMGKVSKDFVDDSIAKAMEYHALIEQQEAIITRIDRTLAKKNLSETSKKLLEGTKAEAEGKIQTLKRGDESKGIESLAVVEALAKYSKEVDSVSNKFNRAGSSIIQGISKFGAALGTAQMVVSKFASSITSSLGDISKLSNVLSPTGAFGSMAQRGIMARTGMSGSEALGFSRTLSGMGLSENDLMRMTAEQRKTFNSLQAYWNEGMGKIGEGALDEFTKTMSEYQEVQLRFSMGLQQMLIKLVADSPKFNEFVGKVGDLMDSTLTFLQSPVVQRVFDGLISFLTTVVTLLDKAMTMASKLTGGGAGSSGTTTTTNTHVVVYGGGQDTSEELARQISYAISGDYGG